MRMETFRFRQGDRGGAKDGQIGWIATEQGRALHEVEHAET